MKVILEAFNQKIDNSACDFVAQLTVRKPWKH